MRSPPLAGGRSCASCGADERSAGEIHRSLGGRDVWRGVAAPARSRGSRASCEGRRDGRRRFYRARQDDLRPVPEMAGIDVGQRSLPAQAAGRAGRSPPRAASRGRGEGSDDRSRAHALKRTIVISAARSTVFRYFTDSESASRRGGGKARGSRGKAGRGGAHPLPERGHGHPARCSRSSRTSGSPSPTATTIPASRFRPGGSRVTITPRGPLGKARGCELLHETADAAVRDAHVPRMALSARALRERGGPRAAPGRGHGDRPLLRALERGRRGGPAPRPSRDGHRRGRVPRRLRLHERTRRAGRPDRRRPDAHAGNAASALGRRAALPGHGHRGLDRPGRRRTGARRRDQRVRASRRTGASNGSSASGSDAVAYSAACRCSRATSNPTPRRSTRTWPTWGLSRQT